MQVFVTVLDLGEVCVAGAGETLGFMGWGGVHALFLFLFILLYSLLMCLTKGQTVINRGVGQLVTKFFMAIPLCVCPSVIWFLFFSSFSPREEEFPLCKDTDTHQLRMHQLTCHNSEHTEPTLHASALSQRQTGLPAVSTVKQQSSSINELSSKAYFTLPFTAWEKLVFAY